MSLLRRFGLIPFSFAAVSTPTQAIASERDLQRPPNWRSFHELFLKHVEDSPKTKFTFLSITAVANCSSSPSACWRVCRFLTSLPDCQLSTLWSLLPHSTCSFRFSHLSFLSCPQLKPSVLWGLASYISQPFEITACAFLPSSLAHIVDRINHSSPNSQHFLESFVRSCIIVTSENLVSHLNSFLGIYLTNCSRISC